MTVHVKTYITSLSIPLARAMAKRGADGAATPEAKRQVRDLNTIMSARRHVVRVRAHVDHLKLELDEYAEKQLRQVSTDALVLLQTAPKTLRGETLARDGKTKEAFDIAAPAETLDHMIMRLEQHLSDASAALGAFVADESIIHYDRYLKVLEDTMKAKAIQPQ